MKICTGNECSRPAVCRGLCKKHYERWLRYGDANRVYVKRYPLGVPDQWIIDNVKHDGSACLTWPFSRHTVDGRAMLGKKNPVRMMCRQANGPAPSSKHMATHSCGNGHLACINPRHLKWGTPKENSNDMVAHGRHHRHGRKILRSYAHEIREAKGQVLCQDLAAHYGVCTRAISDVWGGKTWKDSSP